MDATMHKGTHNVWDCALGNTMDVIMHKET